MTDKIEQPYEEIVAEESFILDAQIEIQKTINDLGLKKSEFAKLIGVSAAYVSQLLGSTPKNLTMKTYANIMYKLGRIATVGSVPSHEACIQDVLETTTGKMEIFLNDNHVSIEGNVVTAQFRNRRNRTKFEPVIINSFATA